MRETKFRQKNKNNGQWFYWGFINGKWINPKQQDNYNKPEDSDQYIGIKDNTKWKQLTEEEQKVWLGSGKTKDEWNGKEIYEGNILGTVGTEETLIDGIVKWMDDRGTYYLVDGDGYVTDSDYCYEGLEWKNLAIVGDIHENPELIKLIG